MPHFSCVSPVVSFADKGKSGHSTAGDVCIGMLTTASKQRALSKGLTYHQCFPGACKSQMYVNASSLYQSQMPQWAQCSMLDTKKSPSDFINSVCHSDWFEAIAGGGASLLDR